MNEVRVGKNVVELSDEDVFRLRDEYEKLKEMDGPMEVFEFLDNLNDESIPGVIKVWKSLQSLFFPDGEGREHFDGLIVAVEEFQRQRNEDPEKYRQYRQFLRQEFIK